MAKDLKVKHLSRLTRAEHKAVHQIEQRFRGALDLLAKDDGRVDPLLDVLEELRALYLKKSADYGAEEDPYSNVRGAIEWGVAPWVGVMIRANDKVRRLQKAARGGKLLNESVVDSFIDLSLYTLIALVLYREQMNERQSG